MSNIQITHLSVTEAARLRGCTVHTIRNAIKKGKLRAQKIGKTWAIERTSFREYQPRWAQQEE